MKKIKIKTFNQPGTYHKSLGMESEDYNKVIVNGDYVYSILSDGFGSTGVGRVAAETTVEATAEFCFKNGEKFFTENERQVAKKLVFDVQQKLAGSAHEIGHHPFDMQSTLVLLCVDTKSQKYVTVHIGDGLISKTTDKKTEIISYPENGVTKQYTYPVYDENVFKHLRLHSGKYEENTTFISSSDGIFENCFCTEEYCGIIGGKLSNPIASIEKKDDCCYNIIEI